ncbi:hypothetical protein BJ978_001769 [Agromyces terreus]|uniref:Uncharacterized protein n=2 Tax=Agromyces terreus TaxID=424795 RepID=A0A9X2KB62_9MICO|nr:hypothetical protein [Agromyces terreus]MCP2371093.1 hypothetical protein [Agromyces terreus]
MPPVRPRRPAAGPRRTPGRRALRRRAAVLGGVLAAGLAVSLLAGCAKAPPAPSPPAGVDLESFDQAEGNGLWLVAADDIAAEVLAAVRAAGPVHASGTFTETTRSDPESDLVRGRALELDYRGRAGSFDARVRSGGTSARIVVDGGTAHVLGNEAYATSIDAPDTAGVVVCTVGAEPVVDRWDPLLDPVDLVSALLGGAPLAVSEPAGDEEQLDIVIGEGAALGVLSVERYGPPLPRTYTAADETGDATFEFADWGVEADPAPAAAELACPGG